MKIENKKLIRKLFVLIFVLLASYFYSDYFEGTHLIDENNIELKQVMNTDLEESINTINEDFKIYFLDVGEADSILISNNGEYALIDAGNNEDGPKLVKYFNSLGIANFKYVIVTHPHEDHIGGMDNIIKNFNIEHFYMPEVIVNNRTYEEVIEALNNKGMSFETPIIDSTFTMADSKFTTLFIGEDTIDLNNSSIVLKLNYKDTSYLFTGDATSEVEKQILNKDLKSDVLKVGHHGSRCSTSAQFLKLVYPKYAIISVGKDNDHGHPHNVILEKLKKLGSKIYRTDTDGTILLSSDGKNITIETIETDTNGGD